MLSPGIRTVLTKKNAKIGEIINKMKAAEESRRGLRGKEKALEQERREKREIEINLLDVLRILLSRWLFILLAGIVAAAAIGLGTHFGIRKKYTASVSMYVYTNPLQEQTGTVSYSELSAADNLIKTYQVIVKSNTILEAVLEDFKAEHPEHAEKNVTVSTLSNAVSVSVPSGTKLIRLDVKTSDPVLSADIANTFAECVPDEIVRITKAGGVEIVDYASVPKSPSSPNLKRNAAIGFLAGVVIASTYFLLRAYLDTTIYTAEEITKISNCPVVGTVPMIIAGTGEVKGWEVTLQEEIINE